MVQIERFLAFIVGAIILILELEFRPDARIGVVVLCLVLMGVVTVDQVIDWYKRGSSGK